MKGLVWTSHWSFWWKELPWQKSILWRPGKLRIALTAELPWVEEAALCQQSSSLWESFLHLEEMTVLWWGLNWASSVEFQRGKTMRLELQRYTHLQFWLMGKINRFCRLRLWRNSRVYMQFYTNCMLDIYVICYFLLIRLVNTTLWKSTHPKI